MTLHVENTPSRVIPRSRLIHFDKDEIARALRAQCQAEGICISEQCKLSIYGMPSGMTSITLFVEGD